jgi:hypothetical protein
MYLYMYILTPRRVYQHTKQPTSPSGHHVSRETDALLCFPGPSATAAGALRTRVLLIVACSRLLCVYVWTKGRLQYRTFNDLHGIFERRMRSICV